MVNGGCGVDLFLDKMLVDFLAQKIHSMYSGRLDSAGVLYCLLTDDEFVESVQCSGSCLSLINRAR